MKSVFNSLHDLNNQGFPSWVSRSIDLAESYQIDMKSCIELSPYQFKELCHERLKNSFIMSWMTDLRNGCESSSILKTYSLYKMNFGTECYLKHIKPIFRIVLSKLRASSHDLEVERGRYVRPKLDITERPCSSCHVIGDEEHFVTDCVNNREMRQSLPFISYSQPEDVISCLVNAIESCVIISVTYFVVIRFYLYIPIL